MVLAMDGSDGESSGEDIVTDFFQEPSDYYQPEKPATYTQYECQDGQTLRLRLIGYSPLWGHLLWNAGKFIAKHLEENAEALVRGKTILELGAGAGLPSLLSALLGARKVVVTDYPDAQLIENLHYNINHCGQTFTNGQITAEGYLWGQPVDPLLAHVPAKEPGFDLLILADILFNHSEHAKLVSTVTTALRHGHGAKALVFFTPYRPWLLQKDLEFFELARAAGLMVSKLLEHKMDHVMFEADPGDEQLRRTVFGYEVMWPENASGRAEVLV